MLWWAKEPTEFTEGLWFYQDWWLVFTSLVSDRLWSHKSFFIWDLLSGLSLRIEDCVSSEAGGERYVFIGY